jgi:hypothetical protein
MNFQLPAKWLPYYSKGCYIAKRVGLVNIVFIGLWTAMVTAQYRLIQCSTYQTWKHYGTMPRPKIFKVVKPTLHLYEIPKKR